MLFMVSVGLHRSHFVFEVLFDVEAEVAIGHHTYVEGVLALFFLAIRDFEGFRQFIKVEELMRNDGNRPRIPDHEVPSFFLEEGISDCTTKIAEPVGFDVDNDLKEVTCSDDRFIFDLKLAVEFKVGVVF